MHRQESNTKLWCLFPFQVIAPMSLLGVPKITKNVFLKLRKLAISNSITSRYCHSATRIHNWKVWHLKCMHNCILSCMKQRQTLV